jgi:hypothetical protein
VYQLPPELKDALMREADYTQKTTQHNRNREALELQQEQIREVFEQQKFEQSIAEEVNAISVLNYQLGQYKQLNWGEMQDGEIMRRRMEMDQIKERMSEVNNQVDGKRNKFKQEQEGRVQELLGKASEQLAKSIPNWSDKTASDVTEYALRQGYTKVEVEHVTNPRDVSVLWKAMQYDKLVSTKADALKKANKAPPVVKPGSVKRMPKDVRDNFEFKKSMKKAKANNASDGEKAEIIRRRLERKFGG